MNEFEQRLKVARRRFRIRLIVGGMVFVVVLAVTFFTIYFPRGVTVQVSPSKASQVANISIIEGLGVVISNKAIFIGEQVTARVSALNHITATVALIAGQRISNVELQELPVRLVLSTIPANPETRWNINSAPLLVGETFEQELPSGLIEIDIDNPYFEKVTLHVEPGPGETVSRQIELVLLARDIKIKSVPQGASVEINGQLLGKTPLSITGVKGGVHGLKLHLEGYFPLEEQIRVTNESGMIVRDYILKTRPATLQISTSPANGEFTVNGVITDISAPIELLPSRKHILQYRKQGYVPEMQTVELSPGQSTHAAFSLAMQTGQVTVRSDPDAEIIIDGSSLGRTPTTLELQTIEQKLTLKHPGYRAAQVTLTPNANRPLLIERTLQLEIEALLSEAPANLTNSIGIKMKLFKPQNSLNSQFTMGAPRNEEGQRANEFLRDAALTRSFYAGVTEVTNGQFGKYRSGPGVNPNLPKTNVSWREAIEFCNWLSDQENLERVYIMATNGGVSGFRANANGYRLLTEAEWEWLARMANRSNKQKFVWGDQLNIPANSGNFADGSGKNSLVKVIPQYNDGFAGPAPVGSFPVDKAGLHDMAGNISEWVHDVYVLKPPAKGQVEINPFGITAGTSHVIKGSNFRTATLTEMRSSFREGLIKGRDDIGFRVARYIYGKE